MIVLERSVEGDGFDGFISITARPSRIARPPVHEVDGAFSPAIRGIVVEGEGLLVGREHGVGVRVGDAAEEVAGSGVGIGGIDFALIVAEVGASQAGAAREHAGGIGQLGCLPIVRAVDIGEGRYNPQNDFQANIKTKKARFRA